MLSESVACDVLARVFAARGFSIERDVAFREGALSFDIDGWDQAARVGFEYLSSEDDEHDDLDAEELSLLEARMQNGELYVLIVDRSDVDSENELADAAARFLDLVAARRGGP